jgi:hypothetical protein
MEVSIQLAIETGVTMVHLGGKLVYILFIPWNKVGNSVEAWSLAFQAEQISMNNFIQLGIYRLVTNIARFTGSWENKAERGRIQKTCSITTEQV